MDRVVDVAERDVVLELVVEDGLEGGEDLLLLAFTVTVTWKGYTEGDEMQGYEMRKRQTYYYAAYIEEDCFWGCHWYAKSSLRSGLSREVHGLWCRSW